MIENFLNESSENIIIYLTVNNKLECNLLHYELEIRLLKHKWESELLKVGGNNVLVDVIETMQPEDTIAELKQKLAKEMDGPHKSEVAEVQKSLGW